MTMSQRARCKFWMTVKTGDKEDGVMGPVPRESLDGLRFTTNLHALTRLSQVTTYLV